MNIGKIRCIKMSELEAGRLFMKDNGDQKLLGFSLAGAPYEGSIIFEPARHVARLSHNVTNFHVLEFECNWSFEIGNLSNFSQFSRSEDTRARLVVDSKAAYMMVEVDHFGGGKLDVDWLIVSGDNQLKIAEGEAMPNVNEACMVNEFKLNVSCGGHDVSIDPFDGPFDGLSN